MGFSSSPEGNWYNLLLYAPAVEEPGLAVLASKEARVAEDIGNPDNSTLSQIPFPASDRDNGKLLFSTVIEVW